MFCVVVLRAVALSHRFRWWLYLQKGKEMAPVFFLVFLLVRSAGGSCGILVFCMLDLCITASVPVKLDAVLTVRGFRSRGVGCNTGMTG